MTSTSFTNISILGAFGRRRASLEPSRLPLKKRRFVDIDCFLTTSKHSFDTSSLSEISSTTREDEMAALALVTTYHSPVIVPGSPVSLARVTPSVHTRNKKQTPSVEEKDKRYTGAPQERRCVATTTRGRACAYVCVEGTSFCHMHAHKHVKPTPTMTTAAPKVDDKPKRRNITKLQEVHAESPYPLLSMLQTDQWHHQQVRVAVGPLKDHVGTVEKWGNGWVSVEIPSVGLHNRRAFELYLENRISPSTPCPETGAPTSTVTPSPGPSSTRNIHSWLPILPEELEDINHTRRVSMEEEASEDESDSIAAST